MEENIIDVVIDEVALEGLDGITLEALYQRLASRLNQATPLKHGFMEQIWLICTKVKGFTFYELEIPREKLIIFDQCEQECVKSNTSITEKSEFIDIYPYFPIDDHENGVQGSCATYYTRKNVSDLTRNLSLSEVNEKYSQSLVIVVSQKLRHQAIIGEEIISNLELPIVQYCLLERVGRSRYFGDISINNSQSDSINDPLNENYVLVEVSQ